MNPHFNGSDYVPECDWHRLTTQVEQIREYMLARGWKTLGEIEAATGHPQASISAQLRNLRKVRFGGYLVEKRRRGDRSEGLFEYLLVNPKGQLELPKAGEEA